MGVLHYTHTKQPQIPPYAAGFTADGEYVVGASAGAAHELHVWTQEAGSLERILEVGPGGFYTIHVIVLSRPWKPVHP